MLPRDKEHSQGTLSLLTCLNHFQQHLIVSSFRLSKSLYFGSVVFKHTNNFGSFFQIIWIVEFKRPNSQNTSALFFPFHYTFYHSNFPFDAQKLTFIHECSHIIILPVS